MRTELVAVQSEAVEVDAVYGRPLDGTDVIEVTDVPVELAALFADAHLRVTGRPAAAHVGDGQVITLAAPTTRPGAPIDGVIAALDRAERPVVLAGPGVVREQAVDGLRALAAAGSLGVLNTWGAKGVFDWRSPHHLATAGLQARDFELGGLADADLIVATGIDDAEALGVWRLAPVVEVAPPDLAAVARGWRRSPREIPVPSLRTELARVTQAGWGREATPIAPSRATRAYSDLLAESGLVAADSGTAGYWVARTFPTRRIGGAIVPARATPGLAAACAVVARLVDPERPVLAVVDAASGEPAGLDATTAAVLAAAAALGVAVPLEVWSTDGDALDGETHATRLARLAGEGGVASLATDPDQLDRMLEVAGPVVAWGGLPPADVPQGRVVGESG